jgi:tellurite resistance protein
MNALKNKPLGAGQETRKWTAETLPISSPEKFRLSPRTKQIGESLGGMISKRVGEMYEILEKDEILKRQEPKKITIIELACLSKNLTEFYKKKTEPFTISEENVNADHWICDWLSKRAFNLKDADNLLKDFIKNKKMHRLILKSDDRQFHVRKADGLLIVERGMPVHMDAVINICFSLAKLRDELETEGVQAAVRYANGSKALDNKEMREILNDYLNFVAAEKIDDEKIDAAPKISKIREILSDKKNEGKRFLILCEGEGQEHELRTHFPDVEVSRHSAEILARTDDEWKLGGGRPDVVIIHTPTNGNVDAAWSIGAREVIPLIVKKSADADRYWQNAKIAAAKAEEARKDMIRRQWTGIQLSLFDNRQD